MSINRRRFCAAGALTLSSPPILGSASAQNRIKVTGTVSSEAGADVAGVEFRLSNDVQEDIAVMTTVDSSGEISLTLPATGPHRVTIFDESVENNNIPVVYSFTNVSISGDGDIGEFVIPEAYQTDIRFVSNDGNPIEDLPVNFRAENGTGVSPGTFTTDSSGYAKYAGATERGVELSSPTEIEIQPPSAPEQIQPVQTVFVTESAEFEYSIANPEQYNAVIVDDSTGSDETEQKQTNSTGTGVTEQQQADSTDSDETEQQRGLLSNNQSERGGPLSNPTNLTTLGFLLSVGGIAYQLVGGR